MGPKLDIDALRALCAIADQGGVTRAAEHLALSQSAVSHKIKRLEQQIHCDLLARRPGGALFTETGEDLLPRARRILALHDEAVQSLSRQPLSGSIRLGMTEDVTSSDLARVLGRFTRLCPDVSVRTHVRMSLVLQDQLDAGEVDLGIMQVFAHQVRPKDRVLSSETVHWVKAKDLELDHSSPLPFLAYDDACFFLHWARDLSEVQLNTVLQCGSSAGIASAVRAGLGVALLPSRFLDSEMEILDGPLPELPQITYVVRQAAKARAHHITALAREIEAGITETPGLRIA
jgi:DNA-binding transcriptional LysR family regulator